jgi:hypothetical protein
MDHAELRDLLGLLTDFKVQAFKSDKLEINFSEVSFFKNEFKEEKAPELDPDELILKQIEDMKVKAMANLQG